MSTGQVTYRPVGAGDAEVLSAFFARVPEGDRTFFKEDVLHAPTITSWTEDQRNRRSLALEPDGSVVGYVAVFPGVGWSSHVGELRVVVDPAARGRGLGRDLARRGLLDALELGLTKLVVEVVADQTASIGLFQSLGFEAEALLRDHVRNRDGELRDLIVLAHSADGLWSTMATLGVDEALG
jgi:RimJ/RimL family protein N-acetyltransferase